jgi:hypothetical protein
MSVVTQQTQSEILGQTLCSSMKLEVKICDKRASLAQPTTEKKFHFPEYRGSRVQPAPASSNVRFVLSAAGATLPELHHPRTFHLFQQAGVDDRFFVG